MPTRDLKMQETQFQQFQDAEPEEDMLEELPMDREASLAVRARTHHFILVDLYLSILCRIVRYRLGTVATCDLHTHWHT